MKNIKLIMFYSLFFLAATSFGQERIPTCTNCEDPKNNIIDNGNNTFTATSAQAYYWRICSGSATITSSNTSQIVTISGNPGTTSRIKLTRFKNGNCYESCEVFTIPLPVPPECDTCQLNMTVIGNNSNGSCEDATVTISGCDQQNNIDYIEWSYALAGSNCPNPYPNGCPISGTGTSVNFPVPTGINGTPPPYHYLQVYADVFYNDGTMCHYWIQELLICDENYEGGSGGEHGLDINIYPNPSKTGDKIAFDGVDFKNINKIEVLDLSGILKTNIKPSKQSFTINNLTSGIYIIRFTTTTNKVIQKKLIIE